MSRKQTFRSTAMKWGWFITLVTTVLILSVNNARSADWFMFFENKLGDSVLYENYIDNGSIQKTPEGTFLVWQKKISPEFPKPNMLKEIWVEDLREVDCSRRRYKVLQGEIYRPKHSKIEPSSSWIYFTPDEESIALFETVCGKGRKK